MSDNQFQNPSDFDSPEEKQADKLRAARDAVKATLASPTWKAITAYLQERCRERLVAVVYGVPGEELDTARADLRALLSIALDFGVSDLQADANLVNLDRMIAERREVLTGQLGLEPANER